MVDGYWVVVVMVVGGGSGGGGSGGGDGVGEEVEEGAFEWPIVQLIGHEKTKIPSLKS